MKNSKIGWTNHTFNAWIGCSKVSPGCKNCYAVRIGARQGVKWGVAQPRKRTSEAYWRQPLHWDKEASLALPSRTFVFTNSLADVFDEEVDPSWRIDLFELIRRTPSLTWQILTKRAEAMAGFFEAHPEYLRPNIWAGVSAEDRITWDARVPHLFRFTPAVRFVSVEPILGEITKPLLNGERVLNLQARGLPDWIICGGESGPGFRAPQREWIESLAGACDYDRVPFFFKQWGGPRPDSNGNDLYPATETSPPEKREDMPIPRRVPVHEQI